MSKRKTPPVIPASLPTIPATAVDHAALKNQLISMGVGIGVEAAGVALQGLNPKSQTYSILTSIFRALGHLPQ